MNKRILNAYLKYAEKQKPILKNCFKHEEGYLICDAYSIILLKDNYNIDVVQDVLSINNMFDNFENNYEFSFKIEELEITSSENEKIKTAKLKDNYEINVTRLNRIKNIIKADDIGIVYNMNTSDTTPIIKLTNTKTNERGYLLPMRKYYEVE